MCGISGYLAQPNNQWPNSLNLSAGVQSMHHRGPDDHGLWFSPDQSTGFGFVRLSIIDLSAHGHQPMQTQDGRWVIVFNGEIYNFQALRAELEAKGETFLGHSDTEILLRSIERIGFEATLPKLRGMFAFAVHDRHTNTTWMARDRLGVKPLVYAERPHGVIFASEIHTLFAIDPTLPRTPDRQALDAYLTFQYSPAPMSGFAHVRKLPPAHAMRIRHGQIESIWRYWDIDFTQRSTLSFDDACAELREQVLEATRLRMIADVPLGAFLSGGVDSSITVAAMKRLGADPLRTYAIGFDDEKFNELPYARQVAEHLGTEHHEMMVHANAVDVMPRMIELLGEPMADNSVMPTYYVSEFARQGVTVALTGDGGDEAFAGYRRFHQMRRVESIERAGLMPVWRTLRKWTVGIENIKRPADKKKVFPYTRADQMLVMQGLERYQHILAFFPQEDRLQTTTDQFRQGLDPHFARRYLEQHWQRAQTDDGLNRYLYLDLMTYLPEDILFKVDITSMANSLECRSPFLDYKVIEFAASLPGKYKLTARGRSKHILKEAFADWLPPGFFDRPKKGFSVPLARWLQTDLKASMEDLLLHQQTLAPWFDQARIAHYVKEHVAGKYHSTKLWPLYVMAQWVKQFNVPINTDME